MISGLNDYSNSGLRLSKSPKLHYVASLPQNSTLSLLVTDIHDICSYFSLLCSRYELSWVHMLPSNTYPTATYLNDTLVSKVDVWSPYHFSQNNFFLESLSGAVVILNVYPHYCNILNIHRNCFSWFYFQTIFMGIIICGKCTSVYTIINGKCRLRWCCCWTLCLQSCHSCCSVVADNQQR